MITRRLISTLLLGLGTLCSGLADDWWNGGPLFHEFTLTLDVGDRAEAAGPFFYSERTEEANLWAVPPLFSSYRRPGLDAASVDVLYPLLSYDRYGKEYRFHIVQLFSWAGGKGPEEAEARRFTVFPFYFQQRSTDPAKNYTAVFPFYGHLEGRLFRSEVDFVLWPIYSKTQRRKSLSPVPAAAFEAGRHRNLGTRRGDVTTINYVYPFFHRRYGEGLEGWQLWPFYGTEAKTVTTRTNDLGDLETVAGFKKNFIGWPCHFNQTTGIGTENPEQVRVLLPFYSRTRSPQRDSTSYGWPLGVTITDDRARGYHEVDAPWPLVVRADGPGKTVRRLWPFYSHAANTNLQSDFILWPIYKYNRVHAEPLDRDRTRILLFGYSRVNERNTATGTLRQRTDLLPFFTHKKDAEGNTRLQVLSVLEPFLPTSPSIERNYSQLWSVWRAERNANNTAASQSLLWNLYRNETSPGTRKCSILFGLFQYESSSQGRRTRLFYVPLTRRAAADSREN